MNSDAVLKCFAAGASLCDLAAVIGVVPDVVEQMVREALDTSRPSSATADRAASRPSRPTPAAPSEPTNGTWGRQAGRQAGAEPRRRRRSRTEIQEATLTALAEGPQTKAALMAATETTGHKVMREVLDELVTARLVTLNGRQYQLRAGAGA